MKFIKKPVVIEAVQLRWDTWNEMCDHAGVGKLSEGKPEGVHRDDGKIEMAIPTLEGLMTANENDYVIRGVKGELYPCKPDIFEATYELASTTKTEGESKVKFISEYKERLPLPDGLNLSPEPQPPLRELEEKEILSCILEVNPDQKLKQFIITQEGIQYLQNISKSIVAHFARPVVSKKDIGELISHGIFKCCYFVLENADKDDTDALVEELHHLLEGRKG